MIISRGNRDFEVKRKTFFLVWQVLSFRLKKQTIENAADTNFKGAVNAGVPQDSILGPAPFLLYFNGLPDVICKIVIYADDATLYSKFDQASDL